MLTLDGVGHRGRGRAPRGRDRRAVRDRHASSIELVDVADQLMWFKYIVKNVAAKHGKTATFMPKPLFGDNGCGMHCHQSLWKEGKPLFAGDGYAGLSDMGLCYIGGILKHAQALAALTNPTTNSYRRLVPGFEAPVNLAYSSRNRSASIRIPIAGINSPKASASSSASPTRSCNPYLAFCGDADGRPRRHPEQDRSRASRSTRTSTPSRPRS